MSPPPLLIMITYLLPNESGHSHCIIVSLLLLWRAAGPLLAQESDLDSDVMGGGGGGVKESDRIMEDYI